MSHPHLYQLVKNSTSKEVLAQLGEFVDYSDYSGRTCAMVAAIQGRNELLNKLIEAGADLTFCDDDGRNALFLATAKGHLPTTKILLRAGLSANIKDNYGWTPFLLAASQDKGHMCAALLEEGADPEARLSNGLGYYSIISQPAAFKVVRKVLRELHPNFIPDSEDLINQGKKGNLLLVPALIKHGARSDFVLDDGHTLLSVLSECGAEHSAFVSTVKKLIKLGADPLLYDGTGQYLIDASKNLPLKKQEELQEIVFYIRSQVRRDNLTGHIKEKTGMVLDSPTSNLPKM